MALHLLKLAVGSQSLDTLRAWVAHDAAAAGAAEGRAVVRGGQVVTTDLDAAVRLHRKLATDLMEP